MNIKTNKAIEYLIKLENKLHPPKSLTEEEIINEDMCVSHNILNAIEFANYSCQEGEEFDRKLYTQHALDLGKEEETVLFRKMEKADSENFENKTFYTFCNNSRKPI